MRFPSSLLLTVTAIAASAGCPARVTDASDLDSGWQFADAADSGNPLDSGSVPDAGVPSDSGTPPDAGSLSLPRPSGPVVNAAIAAGLSTYHRNTSTGDIWCLPCQGAPVMLAAAAFAGDTSVDSRLLAQLRAPLSGGNDPFCTGGYSANDERNVTAMYAIAKRTPRIWSQLTSTELQKIDALMKACLVADIYLTADKTNGGATPKSFMGDTNFSRDWNPNYREGMIGAVIVGTEYFGGQQATEAILSAYDHAAFTAELQSLGLQNAHWTFNTYQSNPGAGAPSPATVEAAITGYRLYGMSLGQLLDIYLNLANDTFSQPVSCGLNNGAGILVGSVYAGRIVSGCAGLPNLGVTGMEKEFDSVDAEGKRSSAGYASLGVRADLFNHLVLVVYGDWADSTASLAALRKVEVGVTDFFYKATQGYEGYSHAKDEGLFKCPGDMDCAVNQALWTELLSKAHGL